MTTDMCNLEDQTKAKQLSFGLISNVLQDSIAEENDSTEEVRNTLDDTYRPDLPLPEKLSLWSEVIYESIESVIALS